MGGRGSWFSAAILCAVACGGHEDVAATNVEPGDAARAGCPAGGVIVERTERWPAGGTRVTLRATGDDGAPWTGDLGACLAITDADGRRVDAAAEPATEETSHLAVVLVPPAAGELDAFAATVEAFLRTRPAAERIGLFAWGERLLQLEAFTAEPARLARALPRLARVNAGGVGEAAAVLREASAALVAVGDPSLGGARSVVVIGAEPVDVDPLPAIVRWARPASLEDDLRAASAALELWSAKGRVRATICTDPEASALLDVSLHPGERATLSVSPSLDGEREGRCDPGVLLRSTRPALHTIDLSLDAEQLARYEELVALVPENVLAPSEDSRVEFALSVRLDPGQEPISAAAHLRGQHALRCDRKSYRIDLPSGDAHFMQEGSASDEFYLIAMCEDAGYFHAFSGDALYREQGLFPLETRYVEVRLNGVTQGVYLMVEQVKQELRRDTSRLRGLIRRPFEPFLLPPDVKYAVDEPALLAAYDALQVVPDGVPVTQHLEDRMDVPGYLRWLAVNAIIENGDTMDESFFYSTETVGPDGAPSDDFHVMAWDPEDQRVLCHSDGVYAFTDPSGLAYCAEAALDHAILADPAAYAAYVDTLERLMQVITPEHYDGVLAAAWSELEPLLARPGVAEAMIEIRATDPLATDGAGVVSAIRARFDEGRAHFRDRHAELSARLAAYRAQTGG